MQTNTKEININDLIKGNNISISLSDDEIGDEHICTGIETPLRTDAFSLSDEEKISKFGESFLKLTNLTVDIVANCIAKIDTPDGSTDDPVFIKEFIDNASKEVFQKIVDHITELKEKVELKPVDAVCSECSAEFTMPISMDQSNFFAVRS